jgi:hypothetical protein
MHIEIDKDNKQIVLTFVGTNEKEIYEKMENIKATLETKYDGETKVILRSRLYVEGDEKEFDKFEKLKPYSIGCEEAQLKVPTWQILSLLNYKLTEEDKRIVAQINTLDNNLAVTEVMTVIPITNYYEEYYSTLEKDRVTHGKRFQRLRQKQYFKKK